MCSTTIYYYYKMNKKNIFQKFKNIKITINKNFLIYSSRFLQTGNLPLYSGLSSPRINALTLCSISVPFSIVVINYILSHSNGAESRNVSKSYNSKECKNADLQEICKYIMQLPYAKIFRQNVCCIAHSFQRLFFWS